jgi:hypothetical protein
MPKEPLIVENKKDDEETWLVHPMPGLCVKFKEVISKYDCLMWNWVSVTFPEHINIYHYSILYEVFFEYCTLH